MQGSGETDAGSAPGELEVDTAAGQEGEPSTTGSGSDTTAEPADSTGPTETADTTDPADTPDGLAGGGGDPAADNATAEALPALQARVVSGRADTVSGGDALIAIDLPDGIEASMLTVTLNSQDITDRFDSRDDGQQLTGLVDSLQEGANTLTFSAAGADAATLELINHASSGPVISGPQEQPFFCQTDDFEIYPDGPTLGGATDADCSIETRIDYVYRNLKKQFLAYDPGQPLPADIDTVTTNEGVTVPYIVRVETGTLNRAVYQTAMLDDLSAPGPSLGVRDPAWNGRLVYAFGGGCRGGWYRQGDATGGVLNDIMLSQGYATASATLNVFGNNCNDLLAAETMMMVKEHFIETYGVPRYTIGRGCSGGSYQVHQIGDNYPGLLDGILPECSFPDVGFATTHTLSDARLLDHYFSSSSTLDWTDEQRRAVAGFGSVGSIANLANGAARIDPVPARTDRRPSAEFSPVVSPEVRYDPIANPAGARATIYDHTVNAYGRDPATGFARRPLDNVGIQYGLQALNAGTISAEQFLDLNSRIGGFDIDANFTAARTVADRTAIDNAYRSGRLLNGGGGLASMPIIDYDYYYTDLEANGDIHMRYQHFSTRARLRKANGRIDNHVMWSGGGNFAELAADGQRFNDIQRRALARMDEWLGNIAADSGGGSAVEKTVRNRPADLVDGCFSRDGDTRFIVEQQVFGGPGTSTCNDLYPAFPPPRQVAGGPLSNDIIKCQLKPVDMADYAVGFSAEQQVRLMEIFPEGVCDWTQPGVGQQGLQATWLAVTEAGQFRSLDD